MKNQVDLTATLYGELRKLAAVRMAEQQGAQTLQATALVHEAWLKLCANEQPQWNNRKHLFAAAAEAMRHILVDRARRRQRLRHGGGLHRIELDAWNWENVDASQFTAIDKAILGLHDALEKLELGDPETTKLVKLHYFAGLSVAETAEAMDLSKRTAERRLAFARAWLNREMRKEQTA